MPAAWDVVDTAPAAAAPPPPVAPPQASAPSADPWSVVSHAPAPMTVGGFLHNAVTSTGAQIKNIGSAIAHPYDTVKNIADVAAGGFNYVTRADGDAPDTGDAADSDAKFHAVAANLKSRYGSLEGLKQSLYTDPAGVAMDLSMLLGGVEGVAGKAAKAADIAKLASVAKAARTVADAAHTINPVVQVTSKVVAPAVSAIASKVADAAPAAWDAIKAGVKAAAPDVAAGTATAGVTTGAAMALPAIAREAVGITGGSVAAKQVATGVGKGFAAARDAWNAARTAPAIPEPVPVPEPITTGTATPSLFADTRAAAAEAARPATDPLWAGAQGDLAARSRAAFERARTQLAEPTYTAAPDPALAAPAQVATEAAPSTPAGPVLPRQRGETFEQYQARVNPPAPSPAAAADPWSVVSHEPVPPTTPEQQIADATEEQSARDKMHGSDIEWANRAQKADRFTKYLTANKLEPTPENLVKATRELAEHDPPSAETVDMIHDRMKYNAPAPAEVGPHGPATRDFEGDPQGAIKWLRSQSTGFAHGAIAHDQIGPIGIPYGMPGNAAEEFSGGYGVAHIDAKHPGWLDANAGKISDWPVDQEAKRPDGTVSAVRLADAHGNRAMVAKDWNGDPHPQWLLTGYERSAPPASVSVRGTPEGAAPTPAATDRLRSSLPLSEAQAAPSDLERQLQASLDARKPAAAPRPGSIAQLDPRAIAQDPVRFQFKRDTGGESGTSDKLKSVNTYDPELGGQLSVWHDPADGKTYVVNGHHRLELAQRSGAPSVDARYIDAADAPEARAKGALINIAEDQGTPLDAAKLFRDTGIGPEDLQQRGIALNGRIARQGLAMSNLSQSLFDRVVAGDIPHETASVIGEMLPGKFADQTAVMDAVEKAAARGKAMTPAEISESIRVGMRPENQITERQESLFGSVEETRSLFAETGELSDYIRRQLATEKRSFGGVSTDAAATRLGKAGNQINVAENLRIAGETKAAQAVYDKLSGMSGPVSDALAAGARKLAAAEGKGTANAIKQATYDAVRRAISKVVPGTEGSVPARLSASGAVGSGEAAEAAAGTLGDAVRTAK